MKPDPGVADTPMLTAARAMHELFLTYRQAGFSERQALFLTAEMMRTVTQNKQQNPEV